MQRPLLVVVLVSAVIGIAVRWMFPWLAGQEADRALSEIAVVTQSPKVLAATSTTGSLLMITTNGEQIFTVDSSKNVTVHSGAALYLNGPLKTSGSSGEANQVLTSSGSGTPFWKNIGDLVTGTDSSSSTTTTTTTTTDLTQAATAGHLLIADGDSWESVGLGGDAGLSAAGTLTINPNAVALGADTTGSYVATIADAGNSTLTVTNGTGEGSAVTLDVKGVTCTDCLNAGHITDIYLLNSGDELTGTLTLRSQNELRFADSDSSNYLAIRAPGTVSSNVTWTLPSVEGSSGQLLSTNGSGTLSWTSGTGVTADSLDFVDFEDALDLDAATTITNALSGNLTIDLTSTGDFIIADAGVAFATFSDAGAVTLANDLTVSGGDITGASGAALDLGEATSGDITVTGDLITADDSFMGISSSAGRIEFDDQSTDEVNIRSARLGVNTATPGARVDVSETENTELIRLSDSTNSDSVGMYAGSGTPESAVTAQLGSIYFDHAGGDVYIKGSGDGTNTGWQELSSDTAHMAKMTRAAAQSINNSTWTKIAFDTEEFDVGSIADSTTNDRFDISHTAKYLVTSYWLAPALDAGEIGRVAVYQNGTEVAENLITSGSSATYIPMVATVLSMSSGGYIEMYVWHSAGSAQDTSTTAQHQPQMTVTELPATTTGADLAEVYFTDETPYPSAGSVVALDPARPGAVRRASGPNDPNAIGIVSSKPGMILGDTDISQEGNPVYVALAGRVSVKVNIENGPIQAGDYLTASSQPGIAMKATKPGAPIVGQALEVFNEPVEGLIKAFIKNSVLPGEVTSQESVLVGPLPPGARLSRLGDLPQVAGLATIDPTIPTTDELPETWLRVDFGEAFKQLLKQQPTILTDAIKQAMAIPTVGIGATELTQPAALAALQIEGGHLVAGSSDVAGSVTIPEGSDYAVIRFKKAFAVVPYVSVVPVGHSEQFISSEMATDQFKIELKNTAARALTFTWLAVQPVGGAAVEFGRRAGEAEPTATPDSTEASAGRPEPTLTPVVTPTATPEATVAPSPATPVEQPGGSTF